MALSRTRWNCLTVSTLLESCVGVGSTFGLWSQALKSRLGYNQQQLAFLATCKDLGVSLGVIAGLFADVYPPWMVLLIGAALNCIGYLSIWLTLTNHIAQHNFWHLCAFSLIGSHGSNWLNTAGMVSMVRSFPLSRGFLIGYLKGFIGLSAAIFVQIFYASVAPDSTKFLLVIAFLPFLIALFLMPYIKVHKRDASQSQRSQKINETRNFVILGIVSTTLAVYLFVCSSFRKIFILNQWENLAIAAGIIFFLFLPFALPLRLSPESDLDLNLPLLPSLRDSVGLCTTIQQTIKLGEPHTLLQAFVRLELWLLFFSMMFGCGSALTVADNIGQITLALDMQASEVVSTYSITSFLGFLVGGYVSEHAGPAWGWPRSVFGVIVFPILTLAHFISSFGHPSLVHVSIMVAGLSFGSMWATSPAILADLFDDKHYASLYNFLIIANPFGSYLLSTQIVGKLYDFEVAKGSFARECHGAHCFRSSFLLLSMSSMVASVLAFALLRCTLGHYNRSR